MSLSSHHKLALVAAAATSAIALTDAVTRGTTGHASVFADTSSVGWALLAGDLVHGLTYVALAVVLVREAPKFAGANRAARVVRWVLLGSLALLATGFLVTAPFHDRILGGPLEPVWGGIATVGFLGMIASSLVLGPLLWRQAWTAYGARVLSAMLPVLGLTVLVAVEAPGWAHPAYLETTLHFGIALVGVGIARPTAHAAVRRTAEAAQSA